MTTETPAAELRARITRALDECRSMIPAAQADVVLSVLRKATQPEIKAAVLSTSEQADTEAAPGPQDLPSGQLRAKIFEWQGSYLDEVKVRQARDAEVARLRAENAELGRQLACVRGDMRDMEAHVREQDAEFERLPVDRAAELREAADRFERECPDAGGPMDLCMCHAAEPLREWADEREAADAYARAINAPPNEATCKAIRERLESGTAPRRRVRRLAAEAQQPTPAPAEETKPEARVCGDRSPATGLFTCQRSPGHTYPHRNAKQKGTETSSWWGRDEE